MVMFPHLVKWSVKGRMSRIFVFAVLSITSKCVLADEGAPAVPVADTKPVAELQKPRKLSEILFIMKEGKPNPVYRDCKPLLKVNETYKLSATEFRETLTRCLAIPQHKRGDLTLSAQVLIDVYGKISTHTCSFELAEDIEDKLVKCVKDKGGIKEFSKDEARSHFSTNGTLDLIFGTQQCKVAGKIWDCTNDLFSKKKSSREIKVCKDNIFAGFEATSEWCDLNNPVEINSGWSNLPAYSLIMGSVLGVVLSKLLL